LAEDQSFDENGSLPIKVDIIVELSSARRTIGVVDGVK
jgi:hypothetical protein